MLATYALLLALNHESVLRSFPADRTRVPPHCAEQFTLDQWQQLAESSLHLRWREHRHFERWERSEREARKNTRDFNASMRALGQIVPPDPVEPTEPFWKRIQQMEIKKDR